MIKGEFPIIFHPYGWDEDIAVEPLQGRKGFIQRCSGEKKATQKGRRLQDRALREAFEQIDTPVKLGEFLSLCGPFSKPSQKGLPTQQVVRWTELLKWQTFMRDLQEQQNRALELEDPLAQVLSRTVSDLTILRFAPPVSWTDGPFIESFARTALEVVAATIAADILNGAELRKCDRQECKRLFVRESKHDERNNNYCSDRCRKLRYQGVTRPSKRGSGDGKA